MNNLKFFDFEVFPNWWCCVVSDEEPSYPGKLYDNKFDKETEQKIKSKMRIYTSDSDLAEVRDALKKELSTGVLCGYNIKRYDLIIAKCIFAGFTPEKLKKANDIIINPNLAYSNSEYARISEFIKFGWNGAQAWQDLYDDSEKGLKDKECALGMDIRETTVPFDKVDLTDKDKEEILFYCKHDVYALHVLYWTVSKAYIDTKILLCDTFGIDRNIGYKNTNANLVGRVLEAQRAHGTTMVNSSIVIRDKTLDEYFKKWLPPEIYDHLLNSAENREFKLCDNIVSIGDGGLHSVYDTPIVNKKACALYVESTDEYTMYNVDVSSCYPSVMLFCNAMSRGCTKPERFMSIYKRRLILKQTPKSQWSEEDKKFVPAAKLVLNTTYGAMGNKYLSLYDDYMRTKVCRVGQMILISIMNNLYKSIPGLKVIQTNTDGVLVYARRADKDKIQGIVDEFSAISNFAFEVEEDNRLWQLNVNNYIALHPDGELKNKGGSFVDTVFQKGTNRMRPLGNFVIQKAQMEFYTKGTNPVEYLFNATNVSDFCLTGTKGPTYSGMVQYNKDGELQLGKVTRVIAVLDDNLGQIKKTKKLASGIKADLIPLCPAHCLIVNDDLNDYYIKNHKLYSKLTGQSWDIDFSYYAEQLNNVLDVTWFEIKNENSRITTEFNL